jgi:hypothetical protein
MRILEKSEKRGYIEIEVELVSIAPPVTIPPKNTI